MSSYISWRATTDLLIVGGGVAGLTCASKLKATGHNLLIVDCGTWNTGARNIVRYPSTATSYAQGGLSIVGLADEPSGDSVQSHLADTLDAGAGLCDEQASEDIISSGAKITTWLIDNGAEFDRNADGSYCRTKEGGHSRSRIIHAGGDATGAEIERALEVTSRSVPAIQNAHMHRILTDEHGVCGAVVHDPRGLGIITTRSLVLATGGSGQLFEVTTNPETALGTGVALGMLAGAAAADVEFMQFHPTGLYNGGRGGRQPLVSEAVRGEGATLLDTEGHSVMHGVDDRADLAPRDIVSRAVFHAMQRTNSRHVYLDATNIAAFHTRFPTIFSSCQALNIDPHTDMIPVAPAAHYQCGGLLVDQAGRTTVPGLYAAGECARTGIHGANRLASNSLLEGLVCGDRIAQTIGVSSRHLIDSNPQPGDIAPVPRIAADHLTQLQAIMTDHCSVMRSHEHIAAATTALEHLRARYDVTGPDILASALVRAAAARPETRGCHTWQDHPSNPGYQRSVVIQLLAQPHTNSTPLEIAGTTRYLHHSPLTAAHYADCAWN